MPRLRPAPKEEEEVEKVAAPAEPEVQVEEAPEVEVEVTEPEVKQDDATIALKKQIEDLKRSEQVLRERNEQFAREREEALERARQREAQIQRVQKQAYDSEADAISSAMAAAQAELDKAELDIENAISLGDAKGQAAAIKRQTIAAANLNRLEEGKAAAEERAKAPPSTEGVDVIDTWGLPNITSTWLKNNRQWLTDPEKFEDLKGYQWQAKKAGITPHTKEFLQFIEDRMNGVPEPEVEVEAKPKEQKVRVSAPPSREVPNANGKRPTPGKVTLTAAEVEAARISGVTPEEYAKQKIRKQQMVDSGEYGEQR